MSSTRNDRNTRAAVFGAQMAIAQTLRGGDALTDAAVSAATDAYVVAHMPARNVGEATREMRAAVAKGYSTMRDYYATRTNRGARS